MFYNLQPLWVCRQVPINTYKNILADLKNTKGEAKTLQNLPSFLRRRIGHKRALKNVVKGRR